MVGRLVALDKCPCVHPLGIGKTWRRLCTKLVLIACSSDTKEKCGIDQFCTGLEAGIEGGIHAISELWTLDSMQSGGRMGFLLVDATNAFNEMNRIGMLCTI
jgi:hypothetical protein